MLQRRKAIREVLLGIRRAAANGGDMPEMSRVFKGAMLRARDSRVEDPVNQSKAFRRSGRVRHAPSAFVPPQGQKRARCVCSCLPSGCIVCMHDHLDLSCRSHNFVLKIGGSPAYLLLTTVQL